MNKQMSASLANYLQQWSDFWCEQTEWPEVIVGDDTVDLMATAAAAVFDACVESQAYAKREGFMAHAVGAGLKSGK